MLKKLLFAFSLVLFAVFAFVGCKDQSLQKAYEKLEIQFAENETKDNVTKNLTLVKEDGNVTISWVSNNQNVVNNEGVVTRQGEDVEVQLTATLSYKNEKKDKSFTVKVLKSEQVLSDSIKNELTAKYVFENSKYTKDLDLVKQLKGVDITWTSSKPEFFSNEGKLVKRPTYTEGNQAITLTASFLNTTKKFVFIIEAAEQTQAEKIKEAMLSVINFGSDNVLKGNLKLNDKQNITLDGEVLPIVWKSSDTNVLTNEGVVIDFENTENKPVKMTATVTKGEDVVTLEYDFLVAPAKIFDTIKQTLTKELLDTTVIVKEVALYKKLVNDAGDVSGFYLVDSEGTIIYINGSNLHGLVENKKFKLKARLEQYFGAFQYANPSFTELSDGTFAAVSVEKTITDITSQTKPSKDKPELLSQLIKLTNVKVIKKGKGNYDVRLALADVVDKNGLTEDNSIAVYYKSNKEVVELFDGKLIQEIYVIGKGYQSKELVWYVDFIGQADDIVLSLTDEERLNLAIETAKNHIEKQLLYSLEQNANFDQVKLGGVTFEFTSSNQTIVDNTGKVLSLPASVQELSINVVAKLANGQQKTGDFKLKVGQLELKTIDQTHELENGSFAIVEVVVTKDLGSGNYAVQDESVKGANLRPGKTKVQVGKKYKIVAKVTEHKQLKQLELVELLEDKQGEVKEVEFNQPLTKENQLANLLQLLKVKDLTITEKFHYLKETDKTVVGKLIDVNGNVINVRIHKNLAKTAEVKALLTFELGTVVKGQLVVSSYDGKPQVAYLNLEKASNLETAAVKLVNEFNNKKFNMDTEITLPKTYTELGATISYAYNPTTAVNGTKWAVVTDDLTVTVTATVVVGEEQKEVTLTITVQKPVEEKIKEKLEETYKFTDGKYTEDLVLVDKLFEVNITWKSDKPEFFSNEGKLLKRPSFAEGDVTVNLTAEFNEASKVFTFVIEKERTEQEKLEFAKTEVQKYNNQKYNMNTDVVFVKNVNEVNVNVTYTYNPTDAVTTENKWKNVTEDTQITVTANLTIGTSNASLEFTVTILDTTPVEEKITKELEKRYVFTDGKYTENLTLVNNLFGVNITWESNKPDYFSNEGQLLKRPTFTEGDVTVNLTAKFNEASKVFTFVIEKAERTDYEKLQEAKERLLELNNQSFDMDTKINLPNEYEDLKATITYIYTPEDAVIDNKWKKVNNDLQVTIKATILVNEALEIVNLNITIKYVVLNIETETINVTFKDAGGNLPEGENITLWCSSDKSSFYDDYFFTTYRQNGSSPLITNDNLLKLSKNNKLFIKRMRGNKIKTMIFEFSKSLTPKNVEYEVEFSFGDKKIKKNHDEISEKKIIIQEIDDEIITIQLFKKGNVFSTPQIYIKKITIIHQK